MIKLIKKANQDKVREFVIGEYVSFEKRFHDGRSYENIITEGIIVKVNKVTVDIEKTNGAIYRVSKDIVK
jgi:hypothetical protein